MADEAFARVNTEQLLKSANGCGVGLSRPVGGDGKADDALTVMETKRASTNLGAGETEKARYVYA